MGAIASVEASTSGARNTPISREEMLATEAVHALRQAATPTVPSGQQGQGFESSVGWGIESAQGISDAAAALVLE